MHQSIETPTLWVPGKGRGYRGMKSHLNNKLSLKGGSFDLFRLWVPSPRGAAVKRETGYQFMAEGAKRIRVV